MKSPGPPNCHPGLYWSPASKVHPGETLNFKYPLFKNHDHDGGGSPDNHEDEGGHDVKGNEGDNTIKGSAFLFENLQREFYLNKSYSMNLW